MRKFCLFILLVSIFCLTINADEVIPSLDKSKNPLQRQEGGQLANFEQDGSPKMIRAKRYGYYGGWGWGGMGMGGMGMWPFMMWGKK